jgi:hypothetical protein
MARIFERTAKDDTMGSAATRIGHAIAQEDGVGNAIKIIEGAFKNR